MLYSNKSLLEKYNKNVPKTWDELLDTAKFILSEEKKHNITDIVGYNGLFTELNYIASLFEFIYSYRNSTDTIFPGFDSAEAIDALNMLKKIKKEISSDELFKEGEYFNIMTLINNKGLFIRFWEVDNLNDLYYITPLPGKKEGINSALVNSINLGISQFISKEKKKAALQVVKYLTSEKIQKEIIVKQFGFYTGLKKLYDDEEVCKILLCSLVKEAQAIHREFKDVDNLYIDQYCKKIVKIFNKFLYENKSAKETLSEIIDISKFYFITLKSPIGMLGFIIFILTACFLLFVFIILWQKKDKDKYSFFTLDFWIIYCLGYLVILSYEFLYYGELSNAKCHIKYSLLFIGINLSTIPILYNLLISFPALNKYSQFLISHKGIFIITMIGIEVLLNIILAIVPFSKEQRIFDDTTINKNFEQCTMKNILGYIIIFFDIIIKIIMILCIYILSYIEWKVIEIYEHVRAIVISEYINGFSFILLIIINHIKINNYEYTFLIHSVIIIIICMTNYIFILAILQLFISKNTEEIDIKQLRELNSIISDERSKASQKSPNKNSLLSKVIYYHSTEYSITTHTSITNISNYNYSFTKSSNIDSNISNKFLPKDFL